MHTQTKVVCSCTQGAGKQEESRYDETEPGQTRASRQATASARHERAHAQAALLPGRGTA